MSKPQSQRIKHLSAAQLEAMPPVIKLFVGRVEVVNEDLDQTKALLKEAMEGVSNCDVFDIFLPTREENGDTIIKGYAFVSVKKECANAVMAACDNLKVHGMNKTDRDGNVVVHVMRDGSNVFEPTQLILSVAEQHPHYIAKPKPETVTA